MFYDILQPTYILTPDEHGKRPFSEDFHLNELGLLVVLDTEEQRPLALTL